MGEKSVVKTSSRRFHVLFYDRKYINITPHVIFLNCYVSWKRQFLTVHFHSLIMHIIVLS